MPTSLFRRSSRGERAVVHILAPRASVSLTHKSECRSDWRAEQVAPISPRKTIYINDWIAVKQSRYHSGVHHRVVGDNSPRHPRKCLHKERNFEAFVYLFTAFVPKNKWFERRNLPETTLSLCVNKAHFWLSLVCANAKVIRGNQHD